MMIRGSPAFTSRTPAGCSLLPDCSNLLTHPLLTHLCVHSQLRVHHDSPSKKCLGPRVQCTASSRSSAAVQQCGDNSICVAIRIQHDLYTLPCPRLAYHELESCLVVRSCEQHRSRWITLRSYHGSYLICNNLAEWQVQASKGHAPQPCMCKHNHSCNDHSKSSSAVTKGCVLATHAGAYMHHDL